LVVFEIPKAAHDRVERRPITRGTARSAVDDQVIRAFGNLGIEVVHQHPERGFLMPSLAGDLWTARRLDLMFHNGPDDRILAWLIRSNEITCSELFGVQPSGCVFPERGKLKLELQTRNSGTGSIHEIAILLYRKVRNCDGRSRCRMPHIGHPEATEEKVALACCMQWHIMEERFRNLHSPKSV